MIQSEQIAHSSLVNGGQTTLHSHPAGGGVNTKSGTVLTSGGSGVVTFNTAFTSTPFVVITPSGSIAIRDSMWTIRTIDTNGFTFDVDSDDTYCWIATDNEVITPPEDIPVFETITYPETGTGGLGNYWRVFKITDPVAGQDNFTGIFCNEDDMCHVTTWGELDQGEEYSYTFPIWVSHQPHQVGIKGSGDQPFEIKIKFGTENWELSRSGEPQLKGVLNAPEVGDSFGSTMTSFTAYQGLPFAPYMRDYLGYAVCAKPTYRSNGISEYTVPVPELSGLYAMMSSVKWSIKNISGQRAWFALKCDMKRFGGFDLAKEFSNIDIDFQLPPPNWEYETYNPVLHEPKFYWASDYTQ